MDPYLIMVNLVPLYASRFSDPVSGLYALLGNTWFDRSPNRSKVISVFFSGKGKWVLVLYHSFLMLHLGAGFNAKHSTAVILGLFPPHLLNHLPGF